MTGLEETKFLDTKLIDQNLRLIMVYLIFAEGQVLGDLLQMIARNVCILLVYENLSNLLTLDSHFKKKADSMTIGSD